MSTNVSLSPTSVASDASIPCASKFGYEDADTDVYEEAALNNIDQYGYGDGSPDDRTKCRYEDVSQDGNAKYGYEEAKPDEKASKYGYEEAKPDDKTNYGYDDYSTSPQRDLTRRPTRRSSMKQSGAPRRASVSSTGEIEVCLPGRKGSVRRRTSITFKDTVNVRELQPAAELTDKPENLWFQSHEYKKMRRKSLDLVEKVEREGVMSGNRKYCIRGLEGMMNSNAGRVQQKMYKVWDSVLIEQEQQREGGKFDDDVMGKISNLNTKGCQIEAIRRAQQDRREIEAYLNFTRRRASRRSSM